MIGTKVLTWNLNSRTKIETLEKQAAYIEMQEAQVVTLQEVTFTSELFFKDYFSASHILSSFDLAPDLSILTGKRKYGQLIISTEPVSHLAEKCEEIPFPERVLSGQIDSLAVEIHTTHVPPGSSNGVIKVEHFEGLYKFLQNRVHYNLILTGDFNSPKNEMPNGEIVTWGQKVKPSGEVVASVNSKWRNVCTGERWDRAERSIIQNHTKLGLEDAFRSVNEISDDSMSWVTRKGVGRRYDHIFCSRQNRVIEAFYDAEPRAKNLSDHSPLISVIELNVN